MSPRALIGHAARLVVGPVAILAAAVMMPQAPTPLSGTCSAETTAAVGHPCYQGQPSTGAAELARAAQLAQVVDGFTCTETPRLSSHAVVWTAGDASRAPRMVPADQAWSQAQAGEVWLELFCEPQL